ERYRPIIDDWNAFQAALAAPQPAVVRVNTLKAGADAVCRRLEDQGFRLRPYAWYPALIRVDGGPFPVTKTLEHWLGYLYAQEAAAAVPVLALGAAPGERILDLSAAPGGKTTQIAELQGDTGLLVANDPQPARVQALLANVYRLGLLSAVVTSVDGRRFPPGPGFDRVLVDAPCSAEGNARRSTRAARAVSPRRAASLAQLQRALLWTGLQLLADGGTLVYSTCTFAPEENEAVVDAVLREAGGAVTVEPIDRWLPGIPGITRWQGQDYHPSLAATRRIYPHHLDSGGMYVARLLRHGPLPQAAAPRQQALPTIRADAELTRRFVDWWCRRFDVRAEVFAGLHAYQRGGDVWLSRHEAAPGWTGVQAVGLRVARGTGRRRGAGRGGVDPSGNGGEGLPRWKPTSLGLVRFAAGARRNVVDLDAESLAALLAGRRVAIAAGERIGPPAGPAAAVDGGFVALRWRGEVLGCGVADGRGLRSAIPQGRAQELLACVDAWRGARPLA
ncbi:MAG TPA: NOL1/NOP2/sun family putative RNA methylase, partial [Bacillota bacterium]